MGKTLLDKVNDSELDADAVRQISVVVAQAEAHGKQQEGAQLRQARLDCLRMAWEIKRENALNSQAVDGADVSITAADVTSVATELLAFVEGGDATDS